jgi:hypothetical protein
MTVLCPNTDEAERLSLPDAGARVRLSWAPEHMHLVRESEGPIPDETDAAATDRALAAAKT